MGGGDNGTAHLCQGMAQEPPYAEQGEDAPAAAVGVSPGPGVQDVQVRGSDK